MSDATACPFFLDLIIESSVAHRFALPVGEHGIGRNLECPIRLIDATVSGLHARLKVVVNPQSVQFYEAHLTDLGSTNGTWVNGNRVTARVPVVIGDRIRCGDVQLVLSGWDGADNFTALAGGSHTNVL